MKMKIKWTRLLLIILVLSIGGYTAFCFMIETDRTFPNTKVNDTDISRMTLREASDVLKDEAKLRSKDSVFTVLTDEHTYTLSVGDALELDYDAAAQEALQKSRIEFFSRGIAWIRSCLYGNHISHPPVKEDSEAFHEAAVSCGLLEDLSSNAADSSQAAAAKKAVGYKIEDDRLLITAGAAKKADEEKLKQKVVAAIQTKAFEEPIECPLISDDLENLERIYEEIHTEASDASLDPDRDYAVVQSVTGVDFDRDAAKKALSEAEEGSTIAVGLIYTEPEITTQYFKEHLFADTLGSYTTKIKGTSNRITNVRLAAGKCDDTILLPGEIFSFNTAVGEQTADRGFRTADAILDGEIIQAYGGGICQVSSTIFAAALYANLDIRERWNHDYVSSYISAGLDAAVAWDALDLLIANPSSFPVKIDIQYSGSDLTVAVLGTRTDDSLIEIETETLEDSPADLLEVVTFRNVYTDDKSQLFHEKITYSAYAK